MITQLILSVSLQGIFSNYKPHQCNLCYFTSIFSQFQVIIRYHNVLSLCIYWVLVLPTSDNKINKGYKIRLYTLKRAAIKMFCCARDDDTTQEEEETFLFVFIFFFFIHITHTKIPSSDNRNYMLINNGCDTQGSCSQNSEMTGRRACS